VSDSKEKSSNKNIIILKHSLPQAVDEDTDEPSSTGVEFAIRNISDITIASAVFEVTLYDVECNILTTVKHTEFELKPKFSRAVAIDFSKQDIHRIRGYDIRITRMTTVNDEKIQLRRHEIKTTDDGHEEVMGFVKNISEIITDTALVANLYNSKKENIGTNVIVLRDIEPGSIRKFRFTLKPQEGNIIKTYTLSIGDIVEL